MIRTATLAARLAWLVVHSLLTRHPAGRTCN